MKKLFNIQDKLILRKKLSEESFKRTTCSFYKYFNIKNLESFRDHIYIVCSNLGILGRIYVANEGINAQISIPNNNLRNLSGGEFQRVLIARAIAKKPDLLVLDEPVQGVDFKGEIALYELIKTISDKLNCGILLISHDLHVVMSATDYVVCLNGHVCCSGTPQAVANNNKYKELFGDRASTILSVYEHRHDHTHSPDGTIKRKQ